MVSVRHRSDVGQYFKEKRGNMQRTLPDLLKQASRLIAVSAATQSQPFGIDDKSEALGLIATNRDINRVYLTPGKVYDDLASRPGQAGAFWRAVKSSNWDAAKKILDNSSSRFKGINMDSFDGGAQHRQLRNNQGRIPASQKPVMIVKNPSALKAYIGSELKKVGQGKGGWASCAKALGSTRGLPRWITKHNSPATVLENYNTSVMKVTMINQVPYASAILSPSQKAEAVRIAIDRLLKSIRIASNAKGETRTVV